MKCTFSTHGSRSDLRQSISAADGTLDDSLVQFLTLGGPLALGGPRDRAALGWRSRGVWIAIGEPTLRSHFLVLLALVAVVSPPSKVRGESDNARWRVLFSGQGGWDTPYGVGGLSASVESGRGWAVGAGAGLSDKKPGDLHLHAVLFARMALWSGERLQLGTVGSFSIAGRERQVESMGDQLRTQWRPGYRADVGLSGRWWLGQFAFRLELGLGLLLNDPTCSYLGVEPLGPGWVGGDCNDPEISGRLRPRPVPGRLAPHVAVGFDYDVLPGEVAEPAARPESRGETRAWVTPTALTEPAGAVVVALYEGFVPDLTVGVTDALQARMALLILPRGSLLRGELRFRVLSLGRFHLAAAAVSLRASGQYWLFWTHALGAVGTVCLDEGCSGSLSLGVFGTRTHDDPDEGSTDRYYSALFLPNLVVPLGNKLRLVGEVYWDPRWNGYAYSLLLRVSLRHLGIEAGAIVEGGTGSAFPIGSLSWRF